MNATKIAYAALILPETPYKPYGSYLTAAADVIGCIDPPSDAEGGGGPVVSRNTCTVFGARIGVRVWADPDGDYGPRLVFDLLAREGITVSADDAAQVLGDIVLESLEIDDAEGVEWFAPEVLFTREDFEEQKVFVAPQNGWMVPEEEFVAPLERTEGWQLRDALRDLQTEEDQRASFAERLQKLNEMPAKEKRMKAAGWAMTGFLGVVATPIGAAMAVIGVFRGMEARLVARVMGVTSLFFVLHHTDALSKVLRQVLH